MSERPVSQKRIIIEIKNSPLSFRETLEQHVKDFGFVIQDLSFDVVVSETTDPDGTRHTTTKPIIIEPAEKLRKRGYQVLVGEGVTYAMFSESYEGRMEADGNQPTYSNTEVTRLPDGFPLRELSRGIRGLAFRSETRLYYSHEARDTKPNKVFVKAYGKDDRFLSELLPLLEKARGAGND